MPSIKLKNIFYDFKVVNSRVLAAVYFEKFVVLAHRWTVRRWKVG